MTADEEIALVKCIREGDQRAKEQLVKANLRFVVSVAKNYQNGRLSLNDLINEGNTGLIKAAERFDETRGFKFISYAVWWIRQSIFAALQEQSRLIKVPSNKISSMSRIKKAMDSWEQKYERLPSSTELAELLDMEEKQIEQTINSFTNESSLNSPIGKEEERSLQDIIPNPENPGEEEYSIQSKYLKKELHRLLSRLTKREQDIIERVFGINYPSAYTLDEIGRVLGISRERVRQIKTRAIKKLSFRPARKQLKALLV